MGGLPSLKNKKCDLTKLPQYSVTCHRPTDVHIKVSQTQDGVATKIDPPYHMACYIMRAKKRGKTSDYIKRLTSLDMMAFSGLCKSEREIECMASLPEGNYVLIVGTFL